MSLEVDTFRRIRSRLESVSEADAVLSGILQFNPSDLDVLKDLAELADKGIIQEFWQNDKRVFLRDLAANKIELRVDLGKLHGYFETYDSLIKAHPEDAPREYQVWADDHAFRGGYELGRSFVQLLKSKAEFSDTNEPRFFLVDQQTVEITITYLASQTVGLSAALPNVTDFLKSTQLDADARWAFFRKAAVRVVRDVEKEKRLGMLMENLAAVYDRAKQNHSLYLERFDFEELLKTFDEQRLKFVGDLNQVLSSIQTALIAVPIGFFLVAEKFKPAGRWLGQNIILVAGGVVFFALLFLISLNQGKTLQGVKFALDDFEDEQNKKVTEESERLKKLLTTTKSQYERVKLFLYAVRILLVLFSLIIVAALLWCSIPALQRLLPYTI